MAQTVDRSNLGYLGPDYQYKLAKCFIEEPKFFAELYSNVDQNKFTEALLVKFVGILKDYFADKGIVPSYETMAILLKRNARLNCDIEECDELIEKLQETSFEGTDVIKDEAIRFFRQQRMIRLANVVLEKVQRGEDDFYDATLREMQDIVSSGDVDDDGFNPYDYEEDALSPTFECPIPTGIGKIDDALTGGLKKGKMGVIIAAGGFGKTTISTAIASYASTYKCDLNNNKGFKVLQIYFEDDNVDIAKKHFSRITDIEARYINRSDEVGEVRRLLDEYADKENFKNNLICKRFPSGKKTISDVEMYLKKLINKGFKPDLIILDYFECLALEKGDKNETRWDREGNTMRRLDVMTKDYNIALWMTTQGNKDSFISDVVKMNQAGGSVTKVQIGGVIMSIARSLEDQDNNRATIAILKNRQGKSGQVFEVKFNNGTSRITCEEVESFDSTLEYDAWAAQKEQETRNRLAQQMISQLKKQNENNQPDPIDYFETEGNQLPQKKIPMGKKSVSKTGEYLLKNLSEE